MRSVLLCGLAASVLVLVVAGPVGALKVNPTPLTNAVAEGSSYSVVFHLDQPILAPTPNPTVVVTLTVADPSRVSLSTSSLEWDAADWFQTRTVTVNVLADGVHNLSNDVVVSGATTSGAPYYNGFNTSFNVSITDADPAPTTTTTSPPTSTTISAAPPAAVPIAVSPAADVATAPQDDGGGLARTGASSAAGIVVGSVLVLVGLVFLVLRRVRPQRA
jgi:hypothetical protein